MSDSNAPLTPQPAHRIDTITSQGAYASGLIVIHSRDEFMLDFISNFASPPRIVGRVISSPPHIKHVLRALLDNTKRYEEAYGPIASQPKDTPPKAEKASDLYAKLQIADELLGGTFSNSMIIKHTRDVFIMDFLTNFPPTTKVTARLIVSPAQIRSIISALESNLSQYEQRFGKIEDRAQSDQQMRVSLN